MMKGARLNAMHCAEGLKGRTDLLWGVFLDHLYGNCIPDNLRIEEVIWRDEPSNEFKEITV